MKINFRDTNEDLIIALIEEWQEPSGPAATWNFDCGIVQGDIFSLPVDAFVSPANSMGVMDGGIDGYYSNTIGWHIGDRLRAMIAAEKYYGELLVGEALMIPTDNEKFPYMISAPTMRTPRLLGTPGAENVFLATRAAVGLALSHNLESIVLPGMGTGCGAVPPKDAAYAMFSGCHSATKFWKARDDEADSKTDSP